MTPESHVFYPDFDLGAFRYAVARYIKLLIRARWTCQPSFLSQDDLERWHLADVETDRLPAWRLLQQAAAALGLLNHDFLPRCPSGGVRETDLSTPVGRLIDEVVALVATDGGGPYHNSTIVDACVKLQSGKGVDWDRLVDWSILPAIRADLDQLPPVPRPTFASLPAGDTAAITGKNVFRRDGKTWTVSYKDLTIGIPHSVGLFYLSLLLSVPNKPLSVSKMRATYTAWKTDPSSRLRMGVEGVAGAQSCGTDGAGDSGDDLHPLGHDLGEDLDSMAIRSYQQRIDQLRATIDGLRLEGKEAQAHDLEGELRVVKKTLQAGLTIGGRPGKMSAASKKDRDAVCASIRRTLSALKESHRLLYVHLARSVKISSMCCYAPETLTVWD